MTQNVVIPYNDQCDEQIYFAYYTRMHYLINNLECKMTFDQLVTFAISMIVDHLRAHNSYQKYYTLNQIEHLGERFANAYIKGQKKLYIY